MRNCMTQLSSNRLRLCLTVMGVTIGALLYLLGATFINSYTQSKYDEFNGFSNNAVYITGSLTKQMRDQLKIQFPGAKFTTFYTGYNSEEVVLEAGGIRITAAPFVYGCDNPCTMLPLPTGGRVVYDTRIVKGRDITADDLAVRRRCVVISELAAELLLPGVEPCGRQIQLSILGAEGEKEAYTVVGVYKNTPVEDALRERILKAKPNSGVSVTLNCYTPSTIYSGPEYQAVQGNQIVFGDDGGKSMYSSLKSVFEGYEAVNIYSYESLYNETTELNASMNSALSIAIIIIMVISGLNIMNSMIFSIRERIPEIGIRKTVGADNVDIVRQMIIEGCITVLIGAFIALILTVLGLIFTNLYLNSLPIAEFRVHFSLRIVARMFCFVLLQGIFASVIPAVYASKIQIVDAIRFD